DEYFRKLLSELFDFQALRNSFDTYSRAVKQYVCPKHPGLLERYRTAEEILGSKIANVGLVFNSRYTVKRLDSDNTIENEAFRNKIQSGCRYFLEQLAPVCKILNDTPTQLDNSSYQTQLNNAMETLRFEMAMKKYILKGLLIEPFNISTYLRIKVSAHLDATNFATTRLASKRKKKSTTRKKS
ncbi:MAG: hypothetical protein NC097_08425, partial [Clostridium sp.]|nr:hypothetical protein [Clostridium sp.]